MWLVLSMVHTDARLAVSASMWMFGSSVVVEREVDAKKEGNGFPVGGKKRAGVLFLVLSSRKQAEGHRFREKKESLLGNRLQETLKQTERLPKLFLTFFPSFRPFQCLLQSIAKKAP